MECFSPDTLPIYCDQLALSDPLLGSIIEEFGYPECLDRPLDYAGLVLVILEQQVSLASARHCFEKLKAKIGQIEPSKVMALSDEELKACGFSRQKTSYVQNLAEEILSRSLNLDSLQNLPDAALREQLCQVKGIGPWTANVVLLIMLRRLDIFPIGDLALRNSIKSLFQLPPKTSHDELLAIADHWKPLRSIATILLWHRYLSLRKKRV